jgi:hypothetical protein
MTGMDIPLNYTGSANKMTGIPVLAMANATFGTSLYVQNDEYDNDRTRDQQKDEEDKRKGDGSDRTRKQLNDDTTTRQYM